MKKGKEGRRGQGRELVTSSLCLLGLWRNVAQTPAIEVLILVMSLNLCDFSPALSFD